ncbi:hypothetical protein [uncultured Shimia sp.]|uniref:hypothetical protein n=1 Tax=uncultured Shimia sp. TaxID=573152 RepID=UPI00262E3EBA|nr:hypothetical protein [uncultured Shimia sp.]
MTPHSKTSLPKGQTRLGIFLEFLGLAAILIAVPLIVRVDLVVLDTRLGEQSITEYLHSAALGVSCLLFLLGARQYPERRGYLVLLACFLLILFIRESDALLDKIEHGFWKYPALVVLIAAGWLARVYRKTIRIPFLDHFEARSFAYFLTGLFIVIFFSRLFGSSVFLKDALGENYSSWTKTIIQESTELLGYLIMLFGAFLSYLHDFTVRR